MKLPEIAGRMRAALVGRDSGWVQQDLGRGLAIVLSRDGDQYRLAMRREGVYPSIDEVAICSRVFGVPDGSEPVRVTPRKSKSPADGRTVVYYVVELHWRESVIRHPEKGAVTLRAPG